GAGGPCSWTAIKHRRKTSTVLKLTITTETSLVACFIVAKPRASSNASARATHVSLLTARLRASCAADVSLEIALLATSTSSSAVDTVEMNEANSGVLPTGVETIGRPAARYS